MAYFERLGSPEFHSTNSLFLSQRWVLLFTESERKVGLNIHSGPVRYVPYAAVVHIDSAPKSGEHAHGHHDHSGGGPQFNHLDLGQELIGAPAVLVLFNGTG